MQLNYQKYVTENGIIYNESEYSLNPSALPAGSDKWLAATPCDAHRWFAGDGWRQNTADNTAVNTWQPIVLASPNLQPKGIVRCASSAETESGLEVYAGTYDIASNPIAAVLPKTDCFAMTGETFGNSLSAPTQGEQIVWFNFDIRPLAGTYQFQVVTNENVGWVLFYVDPANTRPIDGVTTGTSYPALRSVARNFEDTYLPSGNCNNLKFSY